MKFLKKLTIINIIIYSINGYTADIQKQETAKAQILEPIQQMEKEDLKQIDQTIYSLNNGLKILERQRAEILKAEKQKKIVVIKQMMKEYQIKCSDLY